MAESQMLPRPTQRSLRRRGGSSELTVADLIGWTGPLLNWVPARYLGHLTILSLIVLVATYGRSAPVVQSFEALPDSSYPSLYSSPTPLTSQQGDVVVKPAAPTTLFANRPRQAPLVHVVQDGDSIPGLAQRYDITIQTLLWANSLEANEPLAPGRQLVILPISGLVHVVEEGDSVEALARKYQSESQAIAEYNRLTDPTALRPGDELIIPGGRQPDIERPTLASRAVIRPTPRPEQPGDSANPAAGSVPAASRAPAASGTPEAGQPSVLKPSQYQVAEGDTVLAIAGKFGVAAESIVAANDLQGRVESLQIGQKLVIPPANSVLHVVRAGDSLMGIASLYQSQPEKIASANGLADPYVVQPGQTLVVPDGRVPEAPVAPAVASTGRRVTHTVQAGETLLEVAERYGVDADVLVRVNGLANPDSLQLGQELVIPGGQQSASVARAAPVAPSVRHTVAEGESVIGVAQRYGVDVWTIIRANALAEPYTIHPGQQLAIPGGRDSGRTAVAAAPTPRPVAVAPKPTPAPAPPPPPPPPPSSDGWKIVNIASKYLGYRYVWGGTTPAGFDCSGFVYYVFRTAGIYVPRDMWGQLGSGPRVARNNLQPGDIVFFVNTYAPGLTHNGIYIGGGRFIHAATESKGVIVSGMGETYWANRYYGATRPW